MPDSSIAAAGASAQPSVLDSIIDGAIYGDYSENKSATKTISQIGTSFVPIAGQLADLRDTKAAYREFSEGKEGSGWGLAFAVAGWVPLAGDLAKSIHKVGVKETWSGIKAGASAARETWGVIRNSVDQKLGDATGWFYKPFTDPKSFDLDPNHLGVTNRFGDIQISGYLRPKDAQETLDHELVHRALTPTFAVGQKLRADIRLFGYSSSDLLRAGEEVLAETYAKVKSVGLTKGWSGVKDAVSEGVHFPLDQGYIDSTARLKTEAKVLLGLGTTAAAGAYRTGQVLGDSLNAETSAPVKAEQH